MKIRLFIAALLFTTGVALSAEKPSDAAAVRDAKEYIETIEKVSKLKIDDQIDVWQTFLSDHPKQTFRKEIESNIEKLRSLSTKKAPTKQGDEKDAELYLKALEFSKKLSLNDQISMWEQFLDENPTSIYRAEAQSRLFKLKRYKAKMPGTKPLQIQPAPQKTTAPAPTSQVQPTPNPIKTSVAGTKPVKDREKALLLASLAGLVVPGMGHWYTEDYIIAGVLSAIRVAGFAIGIPGVLQSDYNQIYFGSGLALVSYVIDVADAPFSADRFNEKHSAYLLPDPNPGLTIPLMAYSFQF